MPRSFKPRNIPCPLKDCNKYFTNRGGLTNHLRLHQDAYEAQESRERLLQHRNQGANQAADFVDHFYDLDDPFDDQEGIHDEPVHENHQEPCREKVTWHPMLNGRPCNETGEFLPYDALPPPWDTFACNDFSPFKSKESFLIADLLFRRNQTPHQQIDDLMQYWAKSLPPGSEPPFADAEDLIATVDSIEHGHITWQSFTVLYQPQEGEDVGDTPWKLKSYDVWYRDPREVIKAQLSNRDFAKEMDFAAKKVTDEKTKVRRFQDFMSGEWAWEQSDILAKDEKNHGATFCPIILGSDKTTVSVATGQNDYYPMYLSNGLIHNNVRRAHRNGVSLIAFLAIPKTDKEHEDSIQFRRFRRELFHGSVSQILQTLRPGMEEPELLRYADGYYRRTIYGLGAYIADYPEQVILSCIVQDWCPLCTASNKNLDGEGGRRVHELTEVLMEAHNEKTLWFDYGIIPGIMPFTHGFPRADIHGIITPDILHQLVKGAFKDHLVTWVEAYIKKTNTARQAKKILADIDRRIAAVPLFPKLRRFPEGRGFKQWTGNDSKALMKVYLPAIIGYVPQKMVRAIASFMEFCYIVRQSVIDENDLDKLDEYLAKFHKYREVFRDKGVRQDFNLPRQHALTHYCTLIRKFGAPNGLCSSITESKHIAAVKEPWRRSSRFNALSQMLLTNQRLDKLAACSVVFKAHELEDIAPLPAPVKKVKKGDDDDDDGGPIDDRKSTGKVKLAQKPVPNVPREPEALSAWLGIPELPNLISKFLFLQEHLEFNSSANEIPLNECPQHTDNIYLYSSAVSTYFSPSDISGIGGMLRERIRSTHKWRCDGVERQDCVFVMNNPDLPGFRGMYAAQVLAFVKFKHNRVTYRCAVIKQFSTIGDSPCPDTGMWMVQREDKYEIIHIDSIFRAAHLIGIAGLSWIPHRLKHYDSLKAFKMFYINKFIDYNAYEIAF
ncbi:hypothetical protein M378DRAFT_86568 [Amanita muscaria Koide BX008]|uniref:C2H2-type domain-containing protein n=1 Tax=Amanita muscaria (strain Koide BX008) TaxID=946122 RepID=A0A0C2SW97_AMAMK|nr:hypothetical protein M378DRAFT_86568 [Amanita muscaria Koide BX008]